MKNTSLLSILFLALLWLSTSPSAAQAAVTNSISGPYEGCVAKSQPRDDVTMQATLLDTATASAREAAGSEVTVDSAVYYEAGNQYCLAAEFTTSTLLVKNESCTPSVWTLDESAMQSMLFDTMTNAAEDQVVQIAISEVEYDNSGEMYCISALFTLVETIWAASDTELQAISYRPVLMQ